MKNVLVGSLLLSAVAAGGFAADSSVFSYTLGSFEIHMLVESRGQGNPSILINPDKAVLDRYLPGGNYESETNVFLIRAADRTILVDTGFGRAIMDSMKSLGTDPSQVDVILLTHMHGDHIGGLQRDGKALFPRARVYVATQERDFWVKPGTPAAAALAPYEGRVETFLPGAVGTVIRELIPGIKAIAAFGHTPGHTAFELESEGKKFLVWGDLMHVQGIQFPVPDQSVSYDTDPLAAAASRKQILEYAVKNNIPIGGMHLVYPAVGTVSADGRGYRFNPAR
jgi:glyoxylase-like metal-dependent hydrolase (beta-lactamase superfamily II)